MAIRTPYVATDGIIRLYRQNGSFRGIVLIERKNPPYGLALPGGFVDIGESCEEALKREMREETSLDVEIERLLGVYSDPKRDPRFHTISCVYVCRAVGEPKAADDAKKIFIYPPEEIPLSRLVFDHARIIEDFRKTL
ncbi:MAG: NUDIX hydrolase [Campylobacteraceae bacterium 4484_4]|nr:MAG: NUDIX hydrolase [Campylobacteraceae bacterium 4484_4]